MSPPINDVATVVSKPMPIGRLPPGSWHTTAATDGQQHSNSVADKIAKPLPVRNTFIHFKEHVEEEKPSRVLRKNNTDSPPNAAQRHPTVGEQAQRAASESPVDEGGNEVADDASQSSSRKDNESSRKWADISEEEEDGDQQPVVAEWANSLRDRTPSEGSPQNTPPGTFVSFAQEGGPPGEFYLPSKVTGSATSGASQNTSPALLGAWGMTPPPSVTPGYVPDMPFLPASSTTACSTPSPHLAPNNPSKVALSLSDTIQMPPTPSESAQHATPIHVQGQSASQHDLVKLAELKTREAWPTTPKPRPPCNRSNADWSTPKQAGSVVSTTSRTQTPPSSCRSATSVNTNASLGAVPSVLLDGDGIFFSLTIRRAQGVTVGLRVNRSVDSRILQVHQVLVGGAVDAFNRQSAGDRVGIGKTVLPMDKVVSVNGKTDSFCMLKELSTKFLLRILVIRGGFDHELCQGPPEDV
eukprot:TRINITY_DN76819_c0_g1_i1.p1 TRINITY_DN76819_c0_g1~~TRINITY_DN76819_c0_g1_i1.p1  ORF type:complete len:469 (+),score=81.89 TRINITY_DN76819_c0_g1_i1:76-1482(+)